MSGNVVFIVLDSVRKDYFNKFAKRIRKKSSQSYEQCRSASSWSVPSHASILVGDLPHKTGIHSYNCDYSRLLELQTFFDEIPNHRKMGVSANIWASSAFNFDVIFDDFVDISPSRFFPKGIDVKNFDQSGDGLYKYISYIKNCLSHTHPIYSLANGFISHIKTILRGTKLPNIFDDGANRIIKYSLNMVEKSEEPFILFNNFMEAHMPHYPYIKFDSDIYSVKNNWSTVDIDVEKANLEGEIAKENIKNWRELYGAAIDFLDRMIIHYIEKVQNITDRHTTFVITSDHGENLCFSSENKLLGHTSSLSEGLLHVPLEIINPPEGGIQTIEQMTSHLDLGDLIVSLANRSVSSIDRTQVPSELVGMGLHTWELDEKCLNYWNRAIRCVSNLESKTEWDSEENCRRFILDNKKANWQIQSGNCDFPPEQDTDFFEEPILEFNKRVDNPRDLIQNVSSSTIDRLENLGYR